MSTVVDISALRVKASIILFVNSGQYEMAEGWPRLVIKPSAP